MLTQEQLNEIKEKVQSSENPLYFFHDDADGLSSFLLLYRRINKGHGIIVKTTPHITSEKFLNKVSEYKPDTTFILDIAKIDQDFIDNANSLIVWIDHHEPQDRKNVLYFNPRNNEKNIPAAYLCYKAVNQDLWIAMTGCVADWFMPDFKDEFCEKYPDLLSEKINKPEDALFNSQLGKLVKIFSFVLKGKTSDAMKCVKILTRIENPYEILNQETPQGKYLYKAFEKVNQKYENLLKDAVKNVKKEPVLLFIYSEGKMSLTKELSNELLYRYEDKLIVVGREKDDEIKLSLRSSKLNIQKALPKALKDVDGFGGGHEHACGANVKKRDFDKFLKQLKNELKI